MTRRPYLHPNLRRAQPAPTRKQKSKPVTIEKNVKSAFKRTPHRPPGKANRSAHFAPYTSTSLSSRGFLTLPSSWTPPPQPEGSEQSLGTKKVPQNPPQALAGDRAKSIVYATPPPPQPHPPPPHPGGSRSSTTIARPA